MTHAAHPERDQPSRRSIGTTRYGRVFRLCLALVAEAALLFLVAVWLGKLASPALPHPTRIPVSIHWVAQSRVRPRKPEVQARMHPVREPPFPDLHPSAFARQAVAALNQDLTPVKNGVHLGNIPWTLAHAGQGLSGAGLWVDVPFPGGGGLPATGLQVVQTRLYCGSAVGNPGGPVWLAGRVSRSGRVISTWVMRSSDRARVNRLLQRTVKRWRFKPLQIRGHPTWFHIVLISWWRTPPEALLRHPLYPPGTTRCSPPLGLLGGISGVPWSFNGVMPHWVLYPLEGHHPLAVLLTSGPDPEPEVAQAVKLYLLHLEGKLRFVGDRGHP